MRKTDKERVILYRFGVEVSSNTRFTSGPEAISQVEEQEACVCSWKGIHAERRASYQRRCTPPLQAAPWEPGKDGSCFPGDVD